MASPDPDVLLIGGGIMSAHLGAMLKRLDPRLTIEVHEAAAELAGESSDGWNNAGTGHAGLCELNYTPPPAVAGTPVDVTKAVEIFARFEQSRQFWSYAVAHGLAPRPADFIRAVPHLSFVRGEASVAFLRARHAALAAHPFFRTMAFTADREVLRGWTPLLIEGRAAEPVAATRVAAGTDVNFGELSRQLLAWLAVQEGCRVFTGHRVTRLRRAADGWELVVRHAGSGESRPVRARFVFVGAGGGTIPLLQAAGLPVARGLAAFPIAGQWLVCDNPAVVARHFGKVYGPPPPDSGALGGPHLDVRHLHGRRVLLFGPFATWTTKFLHRTGRATDLPASIRPDNVGTLLRTGLHNRVLARFLVQQALQSMESRLRALREFYPEAVAADWRLVDAGIRVQALKQADAGRLSFGTEVVTAPDGTLAALLGASPGASVSANIALQIIQTCFPDRLRTTGGHERMKAMLPTFDFALSQPSADHARHSALIDDRLGLLSSGGA
ncbi:MAG: malate:quinone oxidoreductase [Verrucomicrobia bacterium]|nr:malate:quinone oxidoreductase [Verrucomicrobiota bacterium]